MQRIHELEAQIASLINENESLQKQVSDLTEQNSQLQQQVESLQSQISTLQAQLSDLQQRYDKLQKDFADQASEIIRLTQQITNLGIEIASLTAEIATLTASISAYEAQIAAKDATILALTNQLSDAHNTIDQKNAEIAEKDAQIASLGNQLDSTQKLSKHRKTYLRYIFDTNRGGYIGDTNFNSISYYSLNPITTLSTASANTLYPYSLSNQSYYVPMGTHYFIFQVNSDPEVKIAQVYYAASGGLNPFSLFGIRNVGFYLHSNTAFPQLGSYQVYLYQDHFSNYYTISNVPMAVFLSWLNVSYQTNYDYAKRGFPSVPTELHDTIYSSVLND